MNSYNYDTQKWTSGKEGDRLALQQTSKTLELIAEQPSYLGFIGIKAENEAAYIQTLEAQRSRLTRILER